MFAEFKEYWLQVGKDYARAWALSQNICQSQVDLWSLQLASEGLKK